MEILTKLLEFRGIARRFFQQYQLIIEPIFRFLISYLAFHTINQTLNYNEAVSSVWIELGLAAVSVFLPPVILILFCALVAILQVYSASPILAALVIVIFAVLYCCLRALPAPFAPVHLLFINLLTDSLPALAIGMEPADKNLLKDKPRDSKTGIMTKDFIMKLMAYGAMIAVVTIVAFHIGLETSPEMASTMAFATLTLARLFHGFNCRSNRSIFKIGLGTNKWSIGAFFLGVLLLALVIFIPGLRGLFTVETMAGTQIGTIIGLAVIPSAFIQLIRLVKKEQ